MRGISRKHRAWKTSSLQMSAFPNHPVCREYISLETTQLASCKAQCFFFDVSSTACFPTRHKA